jgi:hypothetical protein
MILNKPYNINLIKDKKNDRKRFKRFKRSAYFIVKSH